MTWDPPANSDGSDIDQYIVYVPSRGIRDNISNISSINLTLSNCGDDIHVQVAAVNRVGCVGMNSSEVLAVPLDIPTAPATTEGGSNTTTEGGSATTTTEGTNGVREVELMSAPQCEADTTHQGFCCCEPLNLKQHCCASIVLALSPVLNIIVASPPAL